MLLCVIQLCAVQHYPKIKIIRKNCIVEIGKICSAFNLYKKFHDSINEKSFERQYSDYAAEGQPETIKILQEQVLFVFNSISIYFGQFFPETFLYFLRKSL